MTGKFYGIGLGPGDPGLLTLKAKEVLETVDVICSPISKEGRRSIALGIVDKVLDRMPEVITPLFPMSRDRAVLEEHWARAAGEIYSHLEKGKDVAFVTIRDPTFYSTFAYVMKIIQNDHPEIEIETVPGVASPLSCMGGINAPLVEGNGRLAVIPAEYGIADLQEIAGTFDTVVLMKVSRSFSRIRDDLEEMGLLDNATLFSRCGREGFVTMPLVDVREEKVDFMSMIVIKR